MGASVAHHASLVTRVSVPRLFACGRRRAGRRGGPAVLAAAVLGAVAASPCWAPWRPRRAGRRRAGRRGSLAVLAAAVLAAAVLGAAVLGAAVLAAVFALALFHRARADAPVSQARAAAVRGSLASAQTRIRTAWSWGAGAVLVSARTRKGQPPARQSPTLVPRDPITLR
jgi:hypothetical protein